MTTTSCIEHLPKKKMVIIREDYVAICTGATFKDKPVDPNCAAGILNIFEYWTNVRLDMSEQAKRHNDIREVDGLDRSQDEDVWVWKTTSDLKKELMSIWGDTKIETARKWLVQDGLLLQRTNPEYKWDKTYQYKLNIEGVNLRLQRSKNKPAIPETTSGDTKETTLSPPETGDDTPPVLESAIIATLKAIHETNGQCAANPDVYAECKNRELIVNGELTPGAYDLIGVDDSTPPLDGDSGHGRCAYCCKRHWSVVYSNQFHVRLCDGCLAELQDTRVKAQDCGCVWYMVDGKHDESRSTYCDEHVSATIPLDDDSDHDATFCDDCGGLLTGGAPDNTYIHCICDNGRAQYVKQPCGCVWYMVDGKHDETRSTYCDEHASKSIVYTCHVCGTQPIVDGWITDGFEELAICGKCYASEGVHEGHIVKEIEPPSKRNGEQLTAEQAAMLKQFDRRGGMSTKTFIGHWKQPIVTQLVELDYLVSRDAGRAALEAYRAQEKDTIVSNLGADNTPVAVEGAPTMQEVDAAIYGTRDEPVKADDDLLADKPKAAKKPRKAKAKTPTAHQLLFGAISEALPGDSNKRTKADRSVIGKAVKQLLEVDAKPEEMKMLFYYCNKRYDNPGAMCMAKYYSAFTESDEYQHLQAALANPPGVVPEQPAEDQDEPSEEDKAKAAALLKELMER
jgi:hypothetical protein